MHLCASMFCFLLFACGSAAGQKTDIGEQRRINELAAILQRPQNALSDSKNLRKEGETLESYMTRLSTRGQGETEQRRNLRIEGYLLVLEKTSEEAKRWRRPAKRDDSSAGNLKLWSLIWKAINALPVRIEKTKSVWKRLQSGETAPLGVELSASLRTLKIGIDALRDARP